MKRSTHVLIALALALAAHGASLLLYPRAVMALLAWRAPPPNHGAHAYLPPPTDHLQRRVVMPSPDLLYATCAYDLRQGPWRIRLDPRFDGYWSIALYAANSDNWFVLNDRRAAGKPVDLLLMPPGASALEGRAGTVLVAPHARGLLLMRLLVGSDAAALAQAETARRTLDCGPLGEAR